jgi:single-strand DNA-binding protein
MASFNKVLLMGNLTRDPDVRVMTNGRPLCKFGIALNRSFKDAEGNRREEVTFVDIECFGPKAEAVGRFFTKGKPILIEGRLKFDQWETDKGEKRSALRVVLENFEFIDSKQDSAPSQGTKPYEAPKASPATETAASTDTETPSSASTQADPELEEDVPF